MSIDTLSVEHKAFSVPPSIDRNQLITLTIGQLQDLVGQAVQKAVQPVQDEVVQLRVTVAAQAEKIAALESTQDTLADNQLIQLRLIKDLRDEVHKEPPAPATTKKSTAHVDDLHRLMVEDRSQQVSIAKAARLLGISKERMRQLKPLILQDGRFEMGWSTVKGKKAVVIRIRQFLK